MELQHDLVDVPEVKECPSVPPTGAPAEEFPARFVDHVLTVALHESPAVISAEWMPLDPERVQWFMRSASTGHESKVLATIPAQMFRLVLARFNYAYLNNQLYGGCLARLLRQGELVRATALHSSNDRRFGLWIRIMTGPS